MSSSNTLANLVRKLSKRDDKLEFGSVTETRGEPRSEGLDQGEVLAQGVSCDCCLRQCDKIGL